MTPKQAYMVILKLAKKAKVPLYVYCAQRGVSPGTLSKWQYGLVKSVSLDTLAKLGIKL